MSKKVLILPGDGIGPEIVGQAKKVLELVNEKHQLGLELEEALIGGSAIDATGKPLPEETISKAKKSDAILLGAVGGPKWEALDMSIRPEKGLLGIRSSLDLFGNLRPA
ncbi:MAG: 3-isopropylmalate dehydrogenase, partial [Gammaproteobacteria bacterium]|nr:3-isopropylmalate dehydrogenase [Gammaproteobacteria bacterium]